MHYRRVIRTGDAGPAESFYGADRPCGVCGQRKPPSEFPRASSRGQRRTTCQACAAAQDRARQMPQPDRIRRNNLARYGLTPASYEVLLNFQGGRCALCHGDEPGGQGTWHVDHDHATGRVRGLLCTHCNVGLGMFRDNPDLLAAAIDYLA